MRRLTGANQQHRLEHDRRGALGVELDGDLAAAAQSQSCEPLSDLLVGLSRLAELGGDRIDRSVRAHLDEQLGGAVEPFQAYPVGTESNVDPAFNEPESGLAAWPVVEVGASAYPQSSLVRLEGAI